MGQINSKLRKTEGGYSHWCPGCRAMHTLPDSWSFNGNLDSPTLTPSFLHQGVKCIYDENGRWTGEWERDAAGKALPYVCHYILTDGILNFCGDCTHPLSGKSVEIPDLPKFYQD